MIPKIFHHLWIKNSPSPLATEYIDRCKNIHDDFSFHLWNDDNLPEMINNDLYKSCDNFGRASDILRYEVLYQYGGIYSDVDMYWQKNIGELISDQYNFIISKELSGEITGALICTSQYNDFIAFVIKRLKEDWNKYSDPIERSGPGFLTRCIKEWTHNFTNIPNDWLILDHTLFFPMGWEARRSYEWKGAYPNSYAVHEYWGMWFKNPLPSNFKKIRKIRSMEELKCQ